MAKNLLGAAAAAAVYRLCLMARPLIKARERPYKEVPRKTGNME